MRHPHEQHVPPHMREHETPPHEQIVEELKKIGETLNRIEGKLR